MATESALPTADVAEPSGPNGVEAGAGAGLDDITNGATNGASNGTSSKPTSASTSASASVAAPASAAVSTAASPADILSDLGAPHSADANDISRPSSIPPQPLQPNHTPMVLPSSAHPGRWTTPSASAPATPPLKPASHIPSGFPSPGRLNTQKFITDRISLTAALKKTSHEVVRRCVRDNWEKCLVGSDFHQAFVLNASVHHASPNAIQRGMRDFGKGLITAAKREIVEQMSTRDLDELTDLILNKASVAFYDKVLEQRLKTIDAKGLINALARAERLGYEPSDVQEDEEASTLHSQPPPPAADSATAVAPQPAAPLYCGICFRRFPAQSACNYHTKMKICTRLPSTSGGFKYNCQNCGQGFTTPMGLKYHHTNQVCGDFGDPGTPVTTNKHPSGAARTLQTPVFPPSMPSRPASQISSPKTPAVVKHVSIDGQGKPRPKEANSSVTDPYAHLSPEQLAAMQSELRDAEIKMTERFRQAHLVPDEAERKTKLDGLANVFATRQSLIRKKYGVRLRSRRTREEILLERERISYRTSAELQADMVGSMARTAGRPIASQQPSNKLETNTGTKRPLSASSSSAPKRLAYADTSGLASGAKAEPAAMDSSPPKKEEPRMSVSSLGTKEEPMALDGSSSEDDSGSDSDGGDEDIPAVLPPSVLQTLRGRSSSVAESSPAAAAAASL